MPIPGTTKLARIAENIGGETLVLCAHDILRLTADVDAIRIEGARYPAHIEATTGL